MTSPGPTQLAKRLIDSRRTETSAGNNTARAAADACEHLYRELSRWVGPDGCHALFTRALAQARPEQPPLKQIQLHVRAKPYVEGVPQAIIAFGEAPTTTALELVIVRLIELLGRLIGEDMAIKLVERSVTLPSDESRDIEAANREEA